MGSWLVLGGTRFLSHAVAAVAVARGHEVVCVARGESGSVPGGATLVVADRDVSGALDPLRGRRFDDAVDVATMSFPWVRDALDAVDAAHWTFVSTINVYADSVTPGQGVEAPLLDPLEEGAEPTPDRDPNAYGAIKVASENAVRAAHPAPLVVRAGLICGPADRSDRFGYWPARFARGGRTAVPDVPDQPMHVVDVRDLAEWIVASGERGLTCTFDGSGPRTTLGAMLDEIAAAVGAPDPDRRGMTVLGARWDLAAVGSWFDDRGVPFVAGHGSRAANRGRVARCRPPTSATRACCWTPGRRGS